MLDSSGIVPLYEQLMDQIKEDIVKGGYRGGEKLPSEIQLAKQNQVSVITARKAINELVAQGLVEKRQGKGTFVATPKIDRDYSKILSFSEVCREQGLTPGSRTLTQRLEKPPEKIQKALGMPQGADSVVISRLRLVDGEPIAIETSYFPMEYSFLLNESLEDSLFAILSEKAGTHIRGSKKQIEICRATDEEAKLLNLRRSAPLLLIRSIAYGDDGKPVYGCTQLINGERFRFIF